VEAVVSSDLYRFSNYAKIWKLKVGSYPVTSALTMTSYIIGRGALIYEPPLAECNTSSGSSNGLAASLLRDGQNQNPKIFMPTNQFGIGSDVEIQVSTGGVSGVNVLRTIEAVGDKILISYRLPDNNAYGIGFSRKALVLVEAAAWCDRLP